MRQYCIPSAVAYPSSTTLTVHGVTVWAPAVICHRIPKAAGVHTVHIIIPPSEFPPRISTIPVTWLNRGALYRCGCYTAYCGVQLQFSYLKRWKRQQSDLLNSPSLSLAWSKVLTHLFPMLCLTIRLHIAIQPSIFVFCSLFKNFLHFC